MTLDDITEVNRLMELIDNIRNGNPPSYYIALREAEVHNIRRVVMRRPNNTPAQEAFYSRDSAGNELEEIFDTNQTKLIRAKINSIRKAALAGEGYDNNTDDGPVQLKGRHTSVRHYCELLTHFLSPLPGVSHRVLCYKFKLPHHTERPLIYKRFGATTTLYSLYLHLISQTHQYLR
jgi:hypothetical protein